VIVGDQKFLLTPNWLLDEEIVEIRDGNTLSTLVLALENKSIQVLEELSGLDLEHRG